MSSQVKSSRHGRLHGQSPAPARRGARAAAAAAAERPDTTLPEWYRYQKV